MKWLFSPMNAGQVRTWLGLYFLVVTGLVGTYLLIFPGSRVLPLTDEEGAATFQIIVPVLVGQLAMSFKWFTDNALKRDGTRPMNMPAWIVKLPPLMAVGVLVIANIALVLSNRSSPLLEFAPKSFQAAVTFCVTILNATTLVLTAQYFRQPESRASSERAPQSQGGLGSANARP